MTTQRTVYHPLTGQLVENEFEALCIEQGAYKIDGDPPVLYFNVYMLTRKYLPQVPKYHSQFTAKEALIFDKLCCDSFMMMKDIKEALGFGSEAHAVKWLRSNQIPLYRFGQGRAARYKVFSGDVVRVVAACELPTEGDAGTAWNAFIDFRAGRVEPDAYFRKRRRERRREEARLQKGPGIVPSRLSHTEGERGNPRGRAVEDHEDHGGGGADRGEVAQVPVAARKE